MVKKIIFSTLLACAPTYSVLAAGTCVETTETSQQNPDREKALKYYISDINLKYEPFGSCTIDLGTYNNKRVFTISSNLANIFYLTMEHALKRGKRVVWVNVRNLVSCSRSYKKERENQVVWGE